MLHFKLSSCIKDFWVSADFDRDYHPPFCHKPSIQLDSHFPEDCSYFSNRVGRNITDHVFVVHHLLIDFISISAFHFLAFVEGGGGKVHELREYHNVSELSRKEMLNMLPAKAHSLSHSPYTKKIFLSMVFVCFESFDFESANGDGYLAMFAKALSLEYEILQSLVSLRAQSAVKLRLSSSFFAF